jgi:hypothetical protein
MCYIIKQVIEFSHNMSKKMLHFNNYQHIPNYNHRIAANDPRVCNNPNNAKTRRNTGCDALWHNKLLAFTQFNQDNRLCTWKQTNYFAQHQQIIQSREDS